MKKSMRLDLIKLIKADAFVAFDDKVRNIMTRAHELNLDAPYIDVNGVYTSYQCFLNAYRFGEYSAADAIYLCYDTNTCDATDNEHPVDLAAVAYDATVYIDTSKHDKRIKETVDDLASGLKSILFGSGNTLERIETKCDQIRALFESLNRSDVAAKDRAAVIQGITTLIGAVQETAQRAWIAAFDLVAPRLFENYR